MSYDISYIQGNELIQELYIENDRFVINNDTKTHF